ncbi:MAG TPA: DNA polymerase III subunit delta [Mycobacteriales bacterium]|jgi:DNA polymerase-3 subunit delta|nr:DNA polymerase III subunit delta [Mycobacteriales bacterium]
MSTPGLPPLRLVVGDEELLVARAVSDSVAAARALDPQTDVRELTAAEIEPGVIYDLLSPSLFAERRVIVVQRAHEARAEIADVLTAYAKNPDDTITLIVVHSGGNRGKALLTALRAAKADEVECKPLRGASERIDFVRAEVSRAGGSISPPAAAALLDAVGNDLRELAAACSQLASDSGGHVDADAVARYHRGRAEVTGFAVADRAVLGDVPGALETLRWALSVGVAHVLVADALADGVRTIARVSSAGGGNPYALASSLGMPPWKVKRAQTQSRGWNDAGLTAALGAVADVNADVKGVAPDPGYALERAIRRVGAARRMGSR